MIVVQILEGLGLDAHAIDGLGMCADYGDPRILCRGVVFGSVRNREELIRIRAAFGDSRLLK